MNCVAESEASRLNEIYLQEVEVNSVGIWKWQTTRDPTILDYPAYW